MRVIIVEDEKSARDNMLALIEEVAPETEVLTCLGSVGEAIDWLNNNHSPDLAFFDIQLADGSSFEIFERYDVNFPVVFTTAFSEYTLKAFKVNSIDYILKPIKKNELEFAIRKYYKLKGNYIPATDLMNVIKSISSGISKNYKRSILVKKHDGFVPVLVSDISYFNIESGIVYCILFNSQVHAIHDKMDSIEKDLSPDYFFRASRQVLLSRQSIAGVSNYFGGRLVIKTKPESKERIIVSKSRVAKFKNWIEY